MKKIYSDEQIVSFAREAERTEATISKFCRQKCFNKGIFISGRSDSIQSRSPKLMRRENRNFTTTGASGNGSSPRA